MRFPLLSACSFVAASPSPFFLFASSHILYLTSIRISKLFNCSHICAWCFKSIFQYKLNCFCLPLLSYSFILLFNQTKTNDCVRLCGWIFLKSVNNQKPYYRSCDWENYCKFPFLFTTVQPQMFIDC